MQRKDESGSHPLVLAGCTITFFILTFFSSLSSSPLKLFSHYHSPLTFFTSFLPFCFLCCDVCFLPELEADFSSLTSHM